MTTGPVRDPGAGPEPPLPPFSRIDPTRGNAARIWNYWLGGKDNYPMDRQVGDEVAEALPEARALARGSRHLLARMLRCLAGQGSEQFLDIGAGLPAVDNTHQAAQKLRPNARVVCADTDPLVLARAHALLTCDPPGVTACIDADLRDPGELLDKAAGTLDFTRPIAVLLIGVLHFITVSVATLSLLLRGGAGGVPPNGRLMLLQGPNASSTAATSPFSVPVDTVDR